MKQPKILRLVLPLALAACLGCASAEGDSQGSPVLDLASLLNGSWQAEGSDLRLEIGSTGSSLTGGAYNLFASATGQAGDRTVNERAVIFLESEAGGVEVTAVPRFDPTVTELSDVTQASPAELRAACTFSLVPTRTGYSGETRGGEACVRAVQGAVGKWNIEVTATPSGCTAPGTSSWCSGGREVEAPTARLESGVPFVYILRCSDGSLYTGIAKDLERRLAQHRAGRASRYTRGRLPVALVWSCEIASWGDALREEIRIKALSRTKKEELVGKPGDEVAGL